MLLVQGWQDQVAHERSLELQRKQHDFGLGIASHMANVVFDKQVEFSEKYAQTVYTVIQKMGQEGPSENALSYSKELQNIRISSAPWISEQLNQNLMPYEAALREIGALATLERTYPNDPSRSDHVHKMFAIFAKFLGIDFEGTGKEPEDFALAILEHLKDILNIPDLELLRRKIVQLATQQIEIDKR